MKLGDGSYVLTLKDIAQAIAPNQSEAAVSKAMRQIRHWTQHDIVRTLSEKSTGSGVPRLYPYDPTNEVCAILQEIARFGATVDILKAVADALYDDLGEGGWPILHALMDEEETRSMMQVSWEEDPESGKLIHPRINFFSTLDAGTDHEEHEGAFDPEPRSSITLNLNKVMDRVRFPIWEWEKSE
jgi:hypothetical protein